MCLLALQVAAYGAEPAATLTGQGVAIVQLVIVEVYSNADLLELHQLHLQNFLLTNLTIWTIMISQ